MSSGHVLKFVGTGKNSLGQLIARAPGWPFQRIALGAVRDEAEIQGHPESWQARVITVRLTLPAHLVYLHRCCTRLVVWIQSYYCIVSILFHISGVRDNQIGFRSGVWPSMYVSPDPASSLLFSDLGGLY